MIKKYSPHSSGCSAKPFVSSRATPGGRTPLTCRGRATTKLSGSCRAASGAADDCPGCTPTCGTTSAGLRASSGPLATSSLA